MSMPAAAAAVPTSSHCVASSLASMLEKEQSIYYRRCPPNPNVPLAEYSKDRSLLVSWCQKLVYKKGDFRSPDELVQTAMALADKYMSYEHLKTYMQDHYQLIVVVSLSIAMKLDSPAKAPSQKELSQICDGAYTPQEIESEEMCILQVLAWYLHPPTASQAANHILALVNANDSIDAGGVDWAPFVDRVHQLINTSVLDVGLSALRPSSVAMAAILVSARTLDDRAIRQRVYHVTLSMMNMLDFDSPCEIDSIQTKLYYALDKNIPRPSPTETQPSH